MRKIIKTPWGAGILCILAALVFELVLFNYHHCTTLFADKEVKVNPADCQIDGGKIIIPDINMRVATVYLKPITADNKGQTLRFRYSDEDSTRTTPWQTRIPSLTRTNYAVLSPYGPVSSLTVEFENMDILAPNGEFALFDEIVLNRVYPLFFRFPRFLLMAGLLFLFWTLRYTRLITVPYFVRKHGARWSRGTLVQEIVRVGTAGVLIAFTAFTAITSMPNDARPFPSAPFPENVQADSYSVLIPDAFLSGRLKLDIDVSESLLETERPYDANYRKDEQVEYTADVAYYNGNYYSHYGVVPAALLFLPFRAVTGRYMHTAIGVFLFSAAALLALLLLWRALVRRYFPNIPFFLSLLSGAALASCSMIVYINRLPLSYAIPIAAGLFFAAAGLWLLVTATEKDNISIWRLALACLCFALAIGCRPGLVVLFAFIPLLLIPRIKSLTKNKKKFALTLTAVLLPYALFGSFLMWYNFARFGSVLEFGGSYALTSVNLGAFSQLNPMQILDKLFCGIPVYLFNTLSIIPWFPYAIPKDPASLSFTGFMPMRTVPGMVFFPVVWGCLGLPFLFKSWARNSKNAQGNVCESGPTSLWLAVAAPIIGLVIMGGVILTDGLAGRYLPDFLWLFALSGLLTLCFLYCRPENNETDRKVLRILLITILIISIVVPILLSFTGEGGTLQKYHTRMYYTLRNLFSLW